MSFNTGQGRARFVPGINRLQSPSSHTIPPRTMNGYQVHSPFNSSHAFQSVAPGMAQNNRITATRAVESPQLSQSDIMTRMLNAAGPQQSIQPQMLNPRPGGHLRHRAANESTRRANATTVYASADDEDEGEEDQHYERTKTTKRKRQSKPADDDTDDEDYEEVKKKDGRKAKRQANKKIQRMSAATTSGSDRKRRDSSVSDSPYVPTTITTPDNDKNTKKKGKSIPVPKCLAEAGAADLMMWKMKHAGKGWQEINERWEALTGYKPGRSTLSVRWLKLNENFSANENANDVLLLACREKAEKKLEHNLWSCTADIMREESSFYHPPDVLKKRYQLLKEREWDLSQAKADTIKDMIEATKTDTQTQPIAQLTQPYPIFNQPSAQVSTGYGAFNQPTGPMMNGNALANSIVHGYPSPYSQNNTNHNMLPAQQLAPGYHMAVSNAFSPRNMPVAHAQSPINMQPGQQPVLIHHPTSRHSPQVLSSQGYSDNNNLFADMHAYAGYYDNANHSFAITNTIQGGLPDQQPTTAITTPPTAYDTTSLQQSITAPEHQSDVKIDQDHVVDAVDEDENVGNTSGSGGNGLVAYDSDSE